VSGRALKDVSVGAFAALALLVVALAVMSVGTRGTAFSGRASYRVVFAEATGLRAGSPVLMNGVQVGSVRRIRLSPDPKTEGIQVEVEIESEYADRVRQDSLAALRFLQYLSGEKYVEISPGTMDAPALAEDGVIPVRESTQILEQGQDIAENLNEITVSLREILEPLERGEGLIGQMIQDPEFGQESLTRLRGTLTNLEELTAGLKEGRGLAGQLLSDEELGARGKDLGQAIADLSVLAADLRRREGVLGELTREGTAGQQAVRDLGAAATSLRTIAARIEAGEGLLGKMVSDREWGDRVAANLGETARNLAEITASVRRGEGTLGKLVTDATLYDGAAEVIAGVNDSSFARWLLRHYQKKGIEAQETEPPAERQ